MSRRQEARLFIDRCSIRLFRLRALPFGSLLGLFLLGTLDRGAHARGALAGMIAGLAAILCVFRFTSVAFTWYVMIGACVTFVTGVVASRLSTVDKSPEEKSPA